MKRHKTLGTVDFTNTVAEIGQSVESILVIILITTINKSLISQSCDGQQKTIPSLHLSIIFNSLPINHSAISLNSMINPNFEDILEYVYIYHLTTASSNAVKA